MGNNLDQIRIDNLEVFANHGVFEQENFLGQKFLVSAVLFTNTRKAGKTDDLTESIHYGEVCQAITEFMKKTTFQLIETVAEKLAEELLMKYERLLEIEVEIKKPWAPIGLPLESVSVRIHRKWHKCYIAFGSNMGDRIKYLDFGIENLRAEKDCRVGKVSEIIETKPYGGVEQDDFLNGVLELDTLKTPEELLSLLQEIEQKADRKREVHWGPRTLDLDILFYDDEIIEEENLSIPHPDMKNRRFVLEPLCNIAPGKMHPLFHMTMAQLLEQL